MAAELFTLKKAAANQIRNELSLRLCIASMCNTIIIRPNPPINRFADCILVHSIISYIIAHFELMEPLKCAVCCLKYLAGVIDNSY